MCETCDANCRISPLLSFLRIPVLNNARWPAEATDIAESDTARPSTGAQRDRRAASVCAAKLQWRCRLMCGHCLPSPVMRSWRSGQDAHMLKVRRCIVFSRRFASVSLCLLGGRELRYVSFEGMPKFKNPWTVREIPKPYDVPIRFPFSILMQFVSHDKERGSLSALSSLHLDQHFFTRG